MVSINTNVASLMLQGVENASKNHQVQHNSKDAGGNYCCDKVGAYDVSQDIVNRIFGSESFFDNMAVFKDMIASAQDTLALMQVQGQGILSLINQAHNGEQTPESLSAINSEVFSKMAEIDRLYKEADFNGVNPFEHVFGFNIPQATAAGLDFNSLFGTSPVENSEAADEKEITDEIASIDVNMDMSALFGNSSQAAEFGMQMSATIKIGFCDDGSLQISVDASLDYDLSGLSKYGAESDNAFDIINNFLNLITGKQNHLGYASNLMDGIFDNIFASMNNSDNGDITHESSSAMSGKIVQHASINLDGAYQMPNIAINIL